MTAEAIEHVRSIGACPGHSFGLIQERIRHRPDHEIAAVTFAGVDVSEIRPSRRPLIAELAPK